MTTDTTNDGLYCLWTENGIYAARIADGTIIGDSTVADIAAARRWAREHLAGCETMDEMPTVARPLADAICEELGLHAELVAVCKID